MEKIQFELYQVYSIKFKKYIKYTNYKNSNIINNIDIIVNNTFLKIFKNLDQYKGDFLPHTKYKSCNIHPTFESWICYT